MAYTSKSNAGRQRRHSARFNIMAKEPIMPAWLLQLILVLIIYSTSQAGYYTSQSFTEFRMNGYVSSINSDAENRTVFIGNISSILTVLVLPFVGQKSLPRALQWFLYVQAYFLFTALWSSVLMATFVLVAKTCIYATATSLIVLRLSYRDTMRAIATAAIVITALSIALAATNPDFATTVGAEGWRGLFAHKNSFASFCLFMTVLLYPAAFNKSTRNYAILSLVLLVSALFLARGKSSIIAALIYLAMSSIVIYAYRSRYRMDRLLRSSTILSVFAAFFGITLSSLFVASGDITFSGRVLAWSWYIRDIADNLILGAGGYTIPRDPALAERVINMRVGTAVDSSYIVILYNFGLVGIIIYIIFLAKCGHLLTKHRSPYAIFAIFSIMIYIVNAAVETGGQLSGTWPTMALLIQIMLVQRPAARLEGGIEGMKMNFARPFNLTSNLGLAFNAKAAAPSMARPKSS